MNDYPRGTQLFPNLNRTKAVLSQYFVIMTEVWGYFRAGFFLCAMSSKLTDKFLFYRLGK